MGAEKVWVAVNGNDVFAASNLKGLCEDIGGVYSTMKDKGSKAEKFSVVVGKMDELRMWYVVRVEVKRVGGRGGKREKKGE